jgi:hypothetical protein
MLIDCENSIPFFIGTLNEVPVVESSDVSSESEQNGISKYITEENGKYTLTLPESQATIKLRDNEDNFVDYISDALVEAAEQKILQDAAKYSDFPCFYLKTGDDGELYLAAEVIYYLDEPDENVGCYDHEHLFFSERISNRTGK